MTATQQPGKPVTRWANSAIRTLQHWNKVLAHWNKVLAGI
jgi:hypothetical protein